MNSKAKISAVLNTYNAAVHLPKVLDSLKDFDEILVCDMESTDNTVAIAQKHGCRVVTFPKGNHSICEPARDFAIHAAAHEWVLVVDADEIVPDGLRDYLYAHTQKDDAADALLIQRRNMFLGDYIHSTPDYQLRFFRQSKAFWAPIIHSRPQINGRIEKIPRGLKDTQLMHLDDSALTSRIDKMNRYSDYEVPKRTTKKYGIAAMLFRPLWFFIKSYIFGGGIRDGKRGIANAYTSAIYQMLLLSKWLENKINEKS